MELKPDATGNVSWCANWQVNSRSVIPIFFLFWTLEFLPPLYSVVLWLWSIKVDSGHKYPVWCWWSRLNGSLSRSFLEEIVAFSFYMPENFKISLLWHLSHSIKTICLFGFLLHVIYHILNGLHSNIFFTWLSMEQLLPSKFSCLYKSLALRYLYIPISWLMISKRHDGFVFIIGIVLKMSYLLGQVSFMFFS